MSVLSCLNCCYNGLQYDSIGLTFGHCSEHKTILRQSHITTCGRLLRKDLLCRSSELAQKSHRNLYSIETVQLLGTRKNVSNDSEYCVSSYDKIAKLVETDDVGRIVSEYGQYMQSGSKINSLAQLRLLRGVRAELALLSLGRAYIQRCFSNDRKWTSGIHLYWWIKDRIPISPDVEIVRDIHMQLPISVPRQVELAKWSILMLRLSFYTDVGYYAQNSAPELSEKSLAIKNATRQVQSLVSLADEAAEYSSTNLGKLIRWTNTEAVKRINTALPSTLYFEIAETLHQDG